MLTREDALLVGAIGMYDDAVIDAFSTDGFLDLSREIAVDSMPDLPERTEENEIEIDDKISERADELYGAWIRAEYHRITKED